MSEIVVRPFRRTDRDQLTALVNAHVRAVVPGLSVSVNAVLSALEREPGEVVLDPWVSTRTTVVAERREHVVAAVHVHRYGSGAHVGEWFRDAAELRWLLCRPDAVDAGSAVVDAALRLTATDGARAVHAGGALPVPGWSGVPDVWPHVAEVLTSRGFAPSRHETLHLATTPLAAPALDVPPTLRRSVGRVGTRLTGHLDGGPVGHVEVDVPGEDGARLSRAGDLADVADLQVHPDHRRRGIGSWLLAAAADWARLGGARRLLAYSEPDEPGLVALLAHAGFVPLADIACGWTRATPPR